MTTFTRATVTIDPTTDVASSVTTTIAGLAIQVRSKPATLERLSLLEAQSPTLLFTPSTYGLLAGTDQFVKPGDTVEWPTGGPTYTAKDVTPVAPDGIVILARIVVAR